jgi:hypothetical protein
MFVPQHISVLFARSSKGHGHFYHKQNSRHVVHKYLQQNFELYTTILLYTTKVFVVNIYVPNATEVLKYKWLRPPEVGANNT